MTTLHEFFVSIAPRLQVTVDELTAYADLDQVGGFHPDPAQRKWIVGSIWEVEGKALYAVIRALKPKRVLEIGTRGGCSATHILSALEANGDGELVSLEIEGKPELDAGLSKRWTFVQGDAVDWLTKNKKHFDLVFEDTDHLVEGTTAIISLLDKVKPKLVISHDGMHPSVGANMQEAWDTVYGEGEYESVLIDPSDCGFLYKFTED